MIPDGPTLIYDKSTIQSLTSREAYWLHHHFHIVLTPTLFIEVLGDLKKDSMRGKSPEEEVGILADKIPNYAVTPNMPYQELILGDLIAERVELGRRPYLGGGKRINNPDGTFGVFFDESPEAKALRHWREKDFNAMEHAMATEWRETINELDLSYIKEALKGIEEGIKTLKTPAEVLSFVDRALKNQPMQILIMALYYLKIPLKYHRHIIARWERLGKPGFPDFAPYAAHVLRVDMLFMFLIARGLISDQRPTHRVDFTYFYYLPFTAIFTSNDKLHKEIAPLLLEEDQCFVEQLELKEDLKALVKYYEALPEEVTKTGTANYAEYPPQEGNFLVSRLYDRLHSHWREYANMKPEPRDPERDKALLEKFRNEIKVAKGK